MLCDGVGREEKPENGQVSVRQERGLTLDKGLRAAASPDAASTDARGTARWIGVRSRKTVIFPGQVTGSRCGQPGRASGAGGRSLGQKVRPVRPGPAMRRPPRASS